jgi:hypothetical protein
LAFGISWLGMVSAALGSHGIAPFDSPYVQLLSIFYAVGPALAAAIVTRAQQMVRQGFKICSRDFSDGGLA